MLLERGADPNALDWNGNRPLTLAAMKHDEQSVRWIFHYGGSINLAPQAVFIAVSDLSLLKLMFAHGANVSIRLQGRTLLMSAESVEVARFLIDRGVDIHRRDNYGRTALHWAAQRRDTSIVRFLLNQRANPDAEDHNHRTPWMAAAQSVNAKGRQVQMILNTLVS